MFSHLRAYELRNWVLEKFRVITPFRGHHSANNIVMELELVSVYSHLVYSPAARFVLALLLVLVGDVIILRPDK